MEVVDTKLLPIRLAHGVTVKLCELLQRHAVLRVAVFSDTQATVQQMAHLELGQGQRFTMKMNRRVQVPLAHSITTDDQWVPEYSGTTTTKDANQQVHIVPDTSGSMVIEQPYTPASNRVRRISKGMSMATAYLDAYKCSNHFCYSLQGMMGT